MESASQEDLEVAQGFRSLATQIQKRNDKGKEIPQFKFTAWPQSHDFQEWKHDFCRDVANGSGQTKMVFEWISPTEEAKGIYELDEKGTEECVDFESVNSKMAGGLYKILDQSGNVRKEVRIQEEKLSQHYPKRMLNGRQVFFMMVEHFKTNEAGDGIHDFEMILAPDLRGDNVDGFQKTWDMIMMRVVKNSWKCCIGSRLGEKATSFIRLGLCTSTMLCTTSIPGHTTLCTRWSRIM